MPIAPQTATSPWSPGRPANEKDIIQAINGDFTPLGVLTSTGAAVDNSTTAVPFLGAPTSPLDTSTGLPRGTLAGTLAGRTLVLQAIAAGFVLTAPRPINFAPSPTVVTVESTLPAGSQAAGFTTFPGFSMSAGQVAVVTMLSVNGWLQWISASGTATLKVYEQA